MRMDQTQLKELFEASLEDYKLSRSEKRSVQSAIQEFGTDPQRVALARSILFQLARENLGADKQAELLDWIEDTVKALTPRDAQVDDSEARAYFSPGHDCPTIISKLIDRSKSMLDICVFTITDNRITDSIKNAKSRGLTIRILTDNDKSNDLGSDIDQLRATGIPVRMDTDPHHMHHKFAIFDQKLLLNGSYNWTRSASEHNQENIVLNSDASLIRTFKHQFEDMWKRFG